MQLYFLEKGNLGLGERYSKLKENYVSVLPRKGDP